MIWAEGEPAEHKKFIENLKAFSKEPYASGWAIMGYSAVVALADGIKKAGSTDSRQGGEGAAGPHLRHAGRQADLQCEDRTRRRRGEFWGEMVKDANFPFAIMKDPEYVDPGPLMN